MKYDVGDQVRIRSDMNMRDNTIQLDTVTESKGDYKSKLINMQWDERHQEMRGMTATIATVVDMGDGNVMYTLAEDQIGGWWAEDFFECRIVDSNKIQQIDVSDDIEEMFEDVDMPRHWKTAIAVNSKYADLKSSDSILGIMSTMREWHGEFKEKIPDQDLLWDLFFSKLRDTLIIEIKQL